MSPTRDRLPVYLITGGTSGVGQAIGLALAQAGLPVLFLTRSKARGEFTAARMKDQTGNPHIYWRVADLTSVASIDQLVDNLKAESWPIRALVHTAAQLVFNTTPVDQRRALMLAANVLGPLRLTLRLHDEKCFCQPARLLTTAGSPGAFRHWGPDLDTFLTRPPGWTLPLYVQTIRYRVLGFLGLAERFRAAGIDVNVFHPGLIKTDLLRDGPFFMRWLLQIVNPWLSTQCPTGVYLATDKRLQGTSGHFFVNRKPVTVSIPDRMAATTEKLIHLAMTSLNFLSLQP